jgi:hypothetical protein
VENKLETGSGSSTNTHRVVTAQGQARVQLSATRFVGTVLLVLALTYAYQIINGKDAHELLTALCTLVALAAGVAVGRRVQ